jgi:hypothetical protein
VNIIHGHVNMAQQSSGVTQMVSMGVHLNDFARLVDEITTHLDELGLHPTEHRKVQAQLAVLSAEMASNRRAEPV